MASKATRRHGTMQNAGMCTGACTAELTRLVPSKVDENKGNAERVGVAGRPSENFLRKVNGSRSLFEPDHFFSFSFYAGTKGTGALKALYGGYEKSITRGERILIHMYFGKFEIAVEKDFSVTFVSDTGAV